MKRQDWLSAVLVTLVFLIGTAKLENTELEDAKAAAYQAGFDAGSGFQKPAQCTTEEAIRWWNNSVDLNEVRKNLCSKKG